MALRSVTPRWLCRLMRWWPPFRAAGIKVEHIADDWTSARVRMRLRRLNRNYFGTQFGGSLYSMCDPFWAMLVLHRLGPGEYVVWDKAAEIEYVAPGRGDVTVEFVLDDARVAEIREATADGAKALPWFDCVVRAEDGSVVALVRKQIYVRRKRPAVQPSQPGRTSPDS
ncbi:Acyl-coenzyme A thioesterase PaaI, contains HGG motif [Streptomyces zhaozhouensis]|uniref:Acyl-coenzyme A thioesterase PaaI, contains HGG motif n=1 Tax=Streptomyces zhaozhouensis TaxID=1300267 RepID=A0A286DWH6_9ACTN|nr:DUF4442 domain-containing protein [Streptomyces zhaozhouensis]SOD63015.1 Acyl-coenzyme A thioesterase PaaI, contains HGG motif [Streptomyces zhaozhouensis]